MIDIFNFLKLNKYEDNKLKKSIKKMNIYKDEREI